VTRRTANWQHILRGHAYRDIRAWLSNINLVLAGIFMLAILVLGPTLFIMRDFVQNIGVYFREVLPLTFSTSAFEGAKGTAWRGSWTMFYWGWWMSWAPFVGVFIARISRGRTIREFVAGVLRVPTLVTFLWFSILGGTAIFRQMEGPGGLLEKDGSIIPENVLFDVLQGLPLGSVLSLLAMGSQLCRQERSSPRCPSAW
jgi:choline/glycine/proline betaine transport protein